MAPQKTPIRFGIQTGQQEVSWEELRDVWLEIEALGYDEVWAYDHFIPTGTRLLDGPCFEGWTLLAALAQNVKRVKIGTLVTGVTYRHPAVLAKEATTVDHVSGGRLLFGIGAGWYEYEHKAYGIPFPGAAERLDRLEEAVQMVKLLWTERRASFEGKYYQLRDALHEPKPLQKPHPRVVIGGLGERRTLRIVARHADEWNASVPLSTYRQKLAMLRQHCDAVGREFSTIGKSVLLSLMVTEDERRIGAALRTIASQTEVTQEQAQETIVAGDPDEVRRQVQAYIDAGAQSVLFNLRAPYDQEGKSRLPDMTERAARFLTTLDDVRRFAQEVMPAFR